MKKHLNESRLSFIADIHLGKLARHLRLLGFDTLYSIAYTKAQLLGIACEQGRVLLSRDPSYSGTQSFSFIAIKHETPEIQLQQLITDLNLLHNALPFSICLSCNGQLLPVTKEKIHEQLEENTRMYYREFWQCCQCQNVYWKGSHYQRMIAMLKKIGIGTDD